ncbi:DHHC palmitoyltransferase-domain-containing protein [Podospora didyma]|uniref:Palmitoyltransferase PFA4 n=1 Tax=Podospora didyma TaxID=330526 RepID=A0AAE0U7S6_9PEZI|nr:DHHC palmitoyltransferase-domain-containing protein [Podospora didyma]
MTSSVKTGPTTKGLQRFAIPFVCVLIGFLGYYSQYLFYTSLDLAPGPLTTQQAAIFNILLACLWWTYYKACTVSPGCYPSTTTPPPYARHCKKCDAPKPPRAHHCRHCGRCIPKMDHHCPWTGNCVSLQTFPYFIRFLLYTNLSLWVLGYHIYERLANIWAERHLPAYLGPTLPHLITLTVMSMVCLGTALALFLLLFTTARGWVLNATMIEEWEMERHEAVLSRDEDKYWNNDAHLKMEKVEFPYDIGLFANLAQGMGTRNVLAWFSPLAGGPTINPTGKGTGWEWEENGFNERVGMWPPIDPEKQRRAAKTWPGAAIKASAREYEMTPAETKAAFMKRQQADFRQRSGIMAELEEVEDDHQQFTEEEDDDDSAYEDQGVPLWTNSSDNTLWDFGVDEDLEEPPIPLQEEDEDDVPLAELIRRRRVLTKELDE